MSKPLDASLRALRPHLTFTSRPPYRSSPSHSLRWRCQRSGLVSIRPIPQARSFHLTSRLREDHTNSSAPTPLNGTKSSPKTSERSSTTSADRWSRLKTTPPSPSSTDSPFSRLIQPTPQPAPKPVALPGGDSASDLKNNIMAEISSSARPKFPIEQMHAPRTNTTTSYSSSSNSSPLSAFSNKVVSSNPAPRTASSSGGNSGRGNIDILSAIPELAPIIQPEQEITTRPFRLKPSLGRTVDIKPEKGVDLARGIAFLGMKLKENDVRGDHIRQRFHERPGLRRKRLKSVRWRKRFMKGFKSMVGLVRHMRAQGW